MIAHVRETWRRRRRQRSAEDLPVWCEQAAIVAAAFARALGQAGPDAPGDVVLNRLDWGLEHLRRLSTAVRRPLAQHDPVLAERLEACLRNVYDLRNQTLSYLIRWGDYRAAERDAGRGDFAERRRALDVRRARDEALLPARQALRRLNAELGDLAPHLQRVAGEWSAALPPASHAA
jgi:hypothetical protein